MHSRYFLTPVVLLLVGMCPSAFAIDTASLAMSGSDLTGEEAEAVEELLQQNPGDIASRAKLLGYYFGRRFGDPSSRERKRDHILWFILNSPESDVLAMPYGMLDTISEPKAYLEGKDAWLLKIESEPRNLKVLEHSASYFQLSDRALAIDSLQKAKTLDSENPKWPRSLGNVYSLSMISIFSKVDAEAAALALKQFERAYELSSDEERIGLYGDLAKAAFGANDFAMAEEYAERMLIENPQDWNYGNNIHHANIILGRIALRADDVEEAKKRLIEAGKTPGSPQLDSFGPTMTLAVELLHKGEKDVVLEYFELCTNFWKMGLDRLDKWSVLVRGGRIPNFWF